MAEAVAEAEGAAAAEAEGAETAAAETATAVEEEEETAAGTTAAATAADYITLVPPEAHDTPSAPDRSQHACARYGAFALPEACDTPSAPGSSCSSQQLFLTACETPSASLARVPLVVRSGDKVAAGAKGRRLQCSLDEVAFGVATVTTVATVATVTTEQLDPPRAAPTTAPAAGMRAIDARYDAPPSDFVAGVLAALAQLPSPLLPHLSDPEGSCLIRTAPFPEGSCSSSARSLHQVETAAVAETATSTVAAAHTDGVVGQTLVHRTAASPARQTLHVVAWAGFGAVYTVEVPGTARRMVPAAKGVQDELLRRLWWRRLWDIMCQGSGDIPY